MTIEMNETTTKRATTTMSHYIDFIEFCQAEVLSDQQEDQPPSKRNSNVKHSAGSFSSVDLGLLNFYKEKCQYTYNAFQECLLLFEIESINKHTAFVPLGKLFENASSNEFNSSNGPFNLDVINARKKLLIDLDVYKSLTLNKVINWVHRFNYLYPIKTIGDGNCLCHAVLSYMIGMQDNNQVLRETLKNFMNKPDYNDELRQRWLLERHASDLANSIQTDDEVLVKEWSEIVSMRQTNLNTKANDHQNVSNDSLIYLEDIHIFALANLLRRPIIVIALPTLKNIQDIHLRGIYLPLLFEPSSCCRDPILIAFHNFHFMPLLFAFDENESATNSADRNCFKYNEKYHYLEMVNDENSDSSESKLAFKRNNEVYNLLPLVYKANNNEKMKLHFLKTIKDADDSSRQEKYLKTYLNIADVELDQQDIDPDCLLLKKNQKKILTCCYLNRQSGFKRVKHDGISSFLSFISESDFKLSKPPKKSESDETYSYKILCREVTCTKESEPNRDGYCLNCYEKKHLMSKELNHEKEHQIAELSTHSTSNSNNYIELSKMVIPNEINTRSPHLSSQTKSTPPYLKLCKSLRCKNVIQKANQEYCESCTSESRVVPIPVHYESSAPKSNKNSNISAYDKPISSGMLNTSRLYNPQVIPIRHYNNEDSSSISSSNVGSSVSGRSGAYNYGNFSNFINDYNRRENCIICGNLYYAMNGWKSSGVCETCELRSPIGRNFRKNF